jgi:hypothetical protein
MWICDKCERQIIPVDGVTAIFDRGYWWCARCVQISHWDNGIPVVAFPSIGKLIPATIMSQDVAP